MATIIIQLDPAVLDHPDADIRYILPDLLVQRSADRLSDDGYDYVGQGNFLHLFLETDDPERDVPGIVEVLTSERLLGNDLSKVPIAIRDGDSFRVVHPPSFAGDFPQSDGG
jgi:hypothetical protein